LAAYRNSVDKVYSARGSGKLQQQEMEEEEEEEEEATQGAVELCGLISSSEPVWKPEQISYRVVTTTVGVGHRCSIVKSCSI
jgi:hypothetical protein